jgi:hypothetical protein
VGIPLLAPLHARQSRPRHAPRRREKVVTSWDNVSRNRLKTPRQERSACCKRKFQVFMMFQRYVTSV